MKKTLSDRRILVTGANGFVGSNLCERLLTENALVTAFVRKSATSEPSNIIHLQNKLRIFYGDLRDFKTLYDSTKDVDVIYHLGAQSHVPDSVREPSGTSQVNALGTLNCLEAARMNDVNLFVNAGSDKIYGDPLYLPLDEKHPLRPCSPYDASKVAGEAFCMAYHKTYGLKVCLPRFSNIYGPRQDRRKVIPDMIDHLLRGESPIIRSDGTPVRDYIFTDDVVEAYLMLADEPKAVGEVINFGTGVGTSVLDLCRLLIDISHVVVKPTILGQSSPAEVQQEYLDISKVKKLFNWSPKVELNKGLSLTWKWYKEHREFFRWS
jgi:nucleoside-diphosphate-sugar epimerase